MSFARASGGARALDRAAGCSWGVPWGGCVVLRRRHRLLMKTWTRRKWTLSALRGPIFPPWGALAPRKSRASFRSRARGENNERGGAEGGVLCRSRPHIQRNLHNFRETQNFRPGPHPQETIWVVRATSRGIYVLTTAPLEYTNTKPPKTDPLFSASHPPAVLMNPGSPQGYNCTVP